MIFFFFKSLPNQKLGSVGKPETNIHFWMALSMIVASYACILYYHYVFFIRRSVDVNVLPDIVAPKKKKQLSGGIKVNHLAKSVTEQWLRSAFINFGTIKGMYLQEGQTENNAFINYDSFEDATKAVEGMNGQNVDGVEIQVKLQDATSSETLQHSRAESSKGSTGPISNIADTSLGPGVVVAETGAKQYTLKVTNISKATTEEKLKSEFGCFKGFVSSKLNVTTAASNYAWVNFANLKGAKAAQQRLNSTTLDGSKIGLSLRESVASTALQTRPNPSSSTSTQVSSTVKASSVFSFSLPKVLNSQPGSAVTVSPLSRPSIFPTPNQFGVDMRPSLRGERESGTSLEFRLQHLTDPIPAKDLVQPAKPPVPAKVLVQPHTPAEPQESTDHRRRHHEEVKDTQFQKLAYSDISATTEAKTAIKQSTQTKHGSQSLSIKTSSHRSERAADLSCIETPNSHCYEKVTTKQPSQETALPGKTFTQKSVVALATTSADTCTVANMGIKQPSQPQSHNPFLAALPKQVNPAQNPSLSNETPRPHSDVTVTEKRLPKGRNVSGKIVQKTVQLPDSLIAKILVSSKFQARLQKIATAFKVSVKRLDQSGTNICLMGLQKDLHRAENEIVTVAEQIEVTIHKEQFPLHCMHTPTFLSAVESIHDIEESHLVKFSVVTSSGNSLEVKAFAEQIQKATTSDTPLQIAQLSPEFLSVRVQDITEYIWFAEDDDGEYRPVHSAVNDIFNCSAPKSFQHDGTEYTVNYLSPQSLMLTVKSTGFTRKMYRDRKAPSWSYHKDNDFGYVPYEQEECKTVEKLYQQGNPTVIEIKGKECTFDFEKVPMIQVDLEDNSPVPVVRYPDCQGTPKYELTLQVRGLQENLSSAKQELERMLSSSDRLVSVSCELPPQHSPALPILLSNAVRQYCVVAHLHRPEGAQQIQLAIQGAGANDYTDKVKVCIMKQSLEFQQRMIHLPRFPPEWEPQSKTRELKLVSEGSSEWNNILHLMRESMQSVQIKKLERIQCKDLWKRYSSFKEEMDKKNKRKTNEKLLFHGTRNTDPKDIFKSEKGFDFRYSSDGLWGRGTYFAVKASYSDQSYSHTIPDGLKQLLLANVLTGESIKIPPDRTLRKPPQKPRRASIDEEDAVTNELYDSVTGVTNGSQVYVVYDHEKSYPAYLLTYL